LCNQRKSQAMQLTAVLTPAEEGGFVAMNPETGTTTQGETIYSRGNHLRSDGELERSYSTLS